MLILASDGGPKNLYTKLQEIKRLYMHSHPDIEAYFYKCNPLLKTEYEIEGDTVYVKTEETYPDLWKKFWLVLQAFENRLHEFDFICRPNLSSFFIIDRYLNYLKTLPTSNYCSGLKFYGGQQIPFPSGYLFTITPDIANYVIYNNIIKDNEGIDDRCMGVILQELKIDIHSFPYIEIENSWIYDNNCLQDNIKDPAVFLIRIRHIASYEEAFGTDAVDRAERDLTLHLLFLIKFYEYDHTIFEKLQIENYLPNVVL